MGFGDKETWVQITVTSVPAGWGLNLFWSLLCTQCLVYSKCSTSFCWTYVQNSQNSIIRKSTNIKWVKDLNVHVCLVAQLCPTLCDLMDCSPPGSSVDGIFQARILEWVAISFFREIFLTQGSNPCLLSLLHWQANSLLPSYLGRLEYSSPKNKLN